MAKKNLPNFLKPPSRQVASKLLVLLRIAPVFLKHQTKLRMKILIVSCLLLFLLPAHAQTKLIAHKSHSGSASTFSKAYQDGLFAIQNANFGLPGNNNIQVLDTVIALNDSVTLFKYRESIVCHRWGTDYKQLSGSDFQAKVDTVVNHPIFNRKNTLKFVKSAATPYPIWFVNLIDEVVFIGFKN